MNHSFHGGIRFRGKQSAANCMIETVSAETVCLSLRRAGCVDAVPTVAPGDRVRLGQRIAVSPDGGDGFPLHSSVSGSVLSVGDFADAAGRQVPSIVLESDGKDTPDSGMQPCRRRLPDMSADEIISLLREAGLCGADDALPLYRRLQSARGKVQHLLINGAETQPYLTARRQLLSEYPKEAVGGAKILLRALGARRATFAVCDNAVDAATELQEAIGKSNLLHISILFRKYPQEHPALLLRTLTGRLPEMGETPEESGCLIVDAELCVAVYRALAKGEPLISRVLTVAGNCVVQPQTLRFPLGTSLAALLSLCGLRRKPRLVLTGGLMTGEAAAAVSVPVDTTTKAVLAFSRPSVSAAADPVCVRCGRCADICPAALVPATILTAGSRKEALRLGADRCLSCGCCTYICPGKLPVSARIRAVLQQDKDAAAPDMPGETSAVQ